MIDLSLNIGESDIGEHLKSCLGDAKCDVCGETAKAMFMERHKVC